MATANTTTTASLQAQANPLGQLSAFLGLPGAPATSAPSLGAFPILFNLTLEDLFSGTGPAAVTNPTAVVTGLFNQVLRINPTATELQNYLDVFNLTGVNGVVAGLYSSTAFRQTEVNNFYLELLGRPATQQELAWDTTRLMWGLSEPVFAASIAGSKAFYESSADGGGPLGPVPTATSYVNLLYRTLLGQAADPTALSAYVQELQAGLPIGLAALQFVTSDAYRQAKVQEIYSVLGETATTEEITKYVQNWFWNGGLAGIATSLLATSSNVGNIEGGQVVLPDMAAAAQLQQLLLAAYTETPEGFVKLYGTLVGDCSDTGSAACINPALYSLLTTGGADRGLSNSSLTLKSITVQVADLIPTQNEIDLKKSLKFPLQDPASLTTYFSGGVIQPFGNPIVTADGGAYIIDGHHRWSAIVLINPNTQVAALDLGYVPTPQDGLKEAQIGVAATKGFLAVSPGGGINLYTTDEQTFNTAVRGYIETAADAHTQEPPPNIPWTDQVLNVFTTYLGLDGQTTDQKYTSIENYLWSNVLRMRALNPFIPGATSREVMPQTDPLPVTQGYLASGALSYSFPTISYLG
ncbi:ParB/Srx family N-terminal domain-containing protein [Mycobacterium sp. NBC_00419]|uniref:ParB/Srx family N-terminal domain-containing protein n=1 Tax=Mycobacterium sp. NBC_00419 TaxID=2975989 RepID=UPI002E237C20